MWCEQCDKTIILPPQHEVETLRGQVPLVDPAGGMFCPDCGNRLRYSASAGDANLDPWEERLEEELEEVRELLAESRDLRESFTRVDTPAASRQPEVARVEPVSPAPEPERVGATIRHSNRGGLPRTPAVILFMLGVGFLSRSWIIGFEAIWTDGLSLDWIGQMTLLCGGLLWLRDAMRSEQEMSGKLDATIAGLHVLRKDLATPTAPHDAHRQLADLKRRLGAIAQTASPGGRS